MLSLLIANSGNNNVIEKRYQIAFFYLFLATFQFVSIVFIFKQDHLNVVQYYYLFPALIGVIFGNHLAAKINDSQLTNFIKLLAFISSIFLISKS